MDESLRKIWWIASFPKSGNTLVRFLVNAYVTRFPLDLNANFQFATVDQNPFEIQRVAAKPIDDLTPPEVAYLRPAALMSYVQSIAPRDACFKTHHANVDVDGIPLIPPRLTKQAVYLVRDPRDVAVSYARHSGLSIDETIQRMASNEHVGDRGNGMQDVVLSWSSHVDSWQRARFPVETIRFEDLVQRREEAARRALQALGFRQIDESALAFALEQTRFENLKRLESENGFRESKHDTFFGRGNVEAEDGASRVGQWREQLSPMQVAAIERNHGETMQRMGYSLVSELREQGVG